MNLSNEDMALFLAGRLTINSHGTRRYYNELGQQHRDDGPAVEYIDGTQLWYTCGRFVKTNRSQIQTEHHE